MQKNVRLPVAPGLFSFPKGEEEDSSTAVVTQAAGGAAESEDGCVIPAAAAELQHEPARPRHRLCSVQRHALSLSLSVSVYRSFSVSISFCLRLSLYLPGSRALPLSSCLSLPPSLSRSSRLSSVPRVFASLTSLIPSTSTDVFKVRGSVALANMHVSHMWLHTRVSWTLRYDDRVEGRRLDRVSLNFLAELRNRVDG